MSDRTQAKTDLSNPAKGVGDPTRPNRGHGELTGRLIKVQDQERRRIARELHDGMGQKIALLKMNLDMLVKLANLSPGSCPAFS